MNSNPTRLGYIATLDGWRAIAVLLVIGAHATHLLANSGTSIGRALASFFEHAGYGVDVFFAISGYLIVTLLIREKDASGRLDLKGFYARRAFRILPPALMYLLAISCLGALGILPIRATDIVSSLFFYRNYFDGSWYTGHFWSLAIEEHFYMVVPLAIGLLSRRSAFKVFVAAAVLCVVVRALEASFLTVAKVEFRTESRFDALMWGSIAAVVASHPPGREWLQRQLTTPRLVCLVTIAVALLVSAHSMPVRRTVVALLMPTVVVFTVLKPHTLIGQALELSWLRAIGRLSYSLYLWQMLFFVPDVHIPALQGALGAVAGTLICAVASYYFVEQPAIQFGRGWLNRKRFGRVRKTAAG